MNHSLSIHEIAFLSRKKKNAKNEKKLHSDEFVLMALMAVT